MKHKIVISGVIGWDIIAKDIKDQIKAAGEKTDLEIEINSPGGSVFEGIEISNAIKSHKGETEITITGLAASMGSYIAVSGDVLNIHEDASFMIHNVSVLVAGDHRDLRKQADLIESFSDILSSAYARKIKKHKSEVRSLMDAETWLFGEEIMIQGFADNIIKVENPEEESEAVAFQKLVFNNCLEKIIKETKDDFEKVALYLNKNKFKNGVALGAFFDSEIDRVAESNDEDRSDVIARIARASGIAEDTVNKIVSGSIICPPLNRLEGFSEILDITIDRIIKEAEKDGCSYRREDGKLISCPSNTNNGGTLAASAETSKDLPETKPQNRRLSGDQPTTRKEVMKLSEFLTLPENAEAKVEHNNLISTAKTEGKEELKTELKATSERVLPIVKSGEYVERVTEAGFEAMAGERTLTSFLDFVALSDQIKEKDKSTTVQDKQPLATPGEGDATPEAMAKSLTTSNAKSLSDDINNTSKVI